MKFLSIELSGYTRISLSGINYIKLTPTKDLQLILGTNGSGKSSLLNEITPLPSISSNYTKDGFSIKTIEHNGSIYVLKSIFSNGQKHIFEKDGNNLNPGGTITVQKDLVKQEFGITPEIHELLMGRERFTRMSPSQRRYWFTQLSSVNYDYAIGLFNRIKEKHRDTTGAIKLNKTRLVAETSKLIPKEEQLTLIEQVEHLHVLIAKVSEVRSPIENSVEEINNEILLNNNILLDTSKKLIGITNRVKSGTVFGNDEQTDETLRDLIARENVIKLLLNSSHSKIEKLAKNIDILKKTSGQGVEELCNQISILKQKQLDSQIKKKLLVDNPHRSPIEAIRALEINKDILYSVFANIPVNVDLQYSTASKNKLNYQLTTIDTRTNELKADLIRLEGKRKHLEDHRDKSNIVCPNCNTSFSFGFSIESYEQTVILIEKHKDELTKLTKEKKLIESEIVDINNYFTIYNNYNSVKMSNPVLKELWDLIDSSIFNTPSSCLMLIDTFYSDLLEDKLYLESGNEIQELNKLLVARRNLDDLDIEKISNEYNEIEIDIFNKQSELNTIVKLIDEIKKYRESLIIIKKLEEQLINTSETFNDLKDKKIETLRRQCVIDGIRLLQSTLASKERQLHELKNQEAIISHLEDNIKNLEQEEYILKILVSELSPTDGLIAEGLFGFIKLFIKQMNSFIKKIWTYDMEIIPCDVSDDVKVELDYKFPIKVEDKAAPVSDVSLGSTGMMEIIDLAFKILAIKHLGLSNSPLYLDEFGATLDHAHRTTIYGIFDYLINQIQFSQVFLVNHYSDLYSSLVNAEVCVLHDSNIEIPKNTVYNKHIVIA